MTDHQRILAILNGEASDQIPLCPRMDLWYIANKTRGTLPEHFIGKNTVEIARELDVGCHAVQADYTLPRPPDSLMMRAFGFDTHPDYAYRVEVQDLPVQFEVEGDTLFTRITTDAGEVTTKMRQTAEMARNGISRPFVESYPIESVNDFEPVAEVFEHLKVIPTPEGYSSFQQRVGDHGIAVAKGFTHASPIHLMLHDLMAVDRFFYLYMDERKALYRLAERMESFFEAVLEASVASSAEVIIWGANFDKDLTYPPFFEQELCPWLKKACQRIHRAGKRVLCHLDGENEGLFPLYRTLDFDIGESVCTAPMVKNTLKEIRQEMGREKTIFGGLPSVALLPNSMSADAFERLLDNLFAQLGSGNHLIFGISDNVPPDADLNRLEQIKQRVQGFGGVEAIT
jgi:hypothetical protein